MPIYEYKCSSCDRQFETMQRLADAPLTTCETCGGDLEKLISAPSFQFKGSGWYVTDYTKSGKKDDSGKDGSYKYGANQDSKKDRKDDSGSSTKKESKDTSSTQSDSSSTKSSSSKGD
jgi:putative FmdB family regulatory protein